MANVTYTSSRGTVFNLLDFDSAKLYKADFHNYSWGKEVVKRQFGEIVNRFTKSAQAYKCTFRFKGAPSVRRTQIEAFHWETEYDICHMEAGTLTWGDTYIKCYMISSDTMPLDNGQTYTENEVTMYCPYPFWIEEQTVEIYPSTESEDDDTAKGYTATKYGYTYSYCGASTVVYIDTEHYNESDFKMILYGPASEVQWTIDGNVYAVDYALRSNQYMVIDSRQDTPADEQCYVVSENGTKTNVFDYRDPTGGELFKKVPSGEFILNYPRTYGLQLTIFKERSEPLC